MSAPQEPDVAAEPAVTLIPYESTDRVPPGELGALETLLALGLKVDRDELVILLGRILDDGAVAVFERRRFPGSMEVVSWIMISYEASRPLEAPYTEWADEQSARTAFEVMTDGRA